MERREFLKSFTLFPLTLLNPDTKEEKQVKVTRHSVCICNPDFTNMEDLMNVGQSLNEGKIPVVRVRSIHDALKFVEVK